MPATLTRADRDWMCLAFAGHAEDVLDELRAGPTVPVYHRRQDLPKGLWTRSRYRAELGTAPVQDGLAPVAEVRLRSRRGRVSAPLYPAP
jgi:hypothetical protein